MAISKLILNGEVQMDVTSDTVTAGSMLSGTTATKNDGTKATGTITTKTSSDLTVSGATVTAPAGYYANAASKAVTTTTHPNPTASITSSTGVVTASHTQTTGYVTSGTTTGTLNLTTQAAQTINTSTADQTIASYRWLTGTQTIKSVTTSNLTAANIAEGVVVRVGDANNASRIAQVTGTHSGATSYTATISGSGNTTYCYVTYSGTKYYSNNGTFNFKAGDTLTIYSRGNSVTINGQSVTLSSYSYTYTLPVGDITINLTYSSSTSNSIAIYGLVKPTGAYTVNAAGTHNIYSYSQATVATGSAFPPAVTITKNPTFSINSSTGVVTASYTGSSSITPTVNSGYITAGIAGIVSTSGTSTYQLTSKAAATIYPSTADQTISSYRWLTGSQTIKGVRMSNLTATNIVKDVVVTVGDVNDASRITQITGTYEIPHLSAILSYVRGWELRPSISFISDWFDSLSIMKSHMFAGTTIISTGTVVFPICSYISDYAFYKANNFSYISFPICSYMGTSAFYECRSLVSVYFPSCSAVNSEAFYNCSRLQTVSFPMCEIIRSNAFYACSSLTEVNFPSCSCIETAAFYNCSKLKSISFPICSTIRTSAFYNCFSLETAIFPECKSIYDHAFARCSSLQNISFPNCIYISAGAFYSCSALTSANFPACLSISYSAFQYCYSLSSINFPVCTTISSSGFYGCSGLLSVSFPSCTIIDGNAFWSCYSLNTARFSMCSSIGSYAFRNCFNLLSLYLLGSSVATLGISAFLSTPISTYTTSTGGVYGKIYVPSSLYNSYITATNWATYSARIVSV